jgi:excisionase family DNA binding protein
METRNKECSMDKPTFLKPVEFAKSIQASKSKVYEMIQRGEIPHAVIGGMIRIPVAALEKFTKEAMQRADAD